MRFIKICLFIDLIEWSEIHLHYQDDSHGKRTKARHDCTLEGPVINSKIDIKFDEVTSKASPLISLES